MKTKLVIISLLVGFTAFGQYYNISLGMSLASQQWEPEPNRGSVKALMLGFNAHFGYDWKFLKYFYYGFRVGYDQTGIEYHNPYYNQSFSYLELQQILKIKVSYSPVYFGIGGYGGILMSRSEFVNNQVQNLPRSQYLSYDYGIEPIIGAELTLDFFKIFSQVEYKFGFPDIYKPGDINIKNRSILILLGISFYVL